MLLHSIRVRFATNAIDIAWLEGELVRRGARDAHRTHDGDLVIVVAAASDADAVLHVRRLLDYVVCGFPWERRWTSQKTRNTTTPTARSAKAIQPQSVVSSSG